MSKINPSSKLIVVFGTRPEVIKLAPLIQLIRTSPLKDNLVVINTGQHTTLLKEQLAFWNIEADHQLAVPDSGGNLVRLLSNTLTALQNYLDDIPNIGYLICQGDTNTSLACAHLAHLNKIKLLHIEAGLRSFNLENPFPEEFNRRVTSLAAFHYFTPTQRALENLVSEGIPEQSITVTGNTGIDAVKLVAGSRVISAEPKTVLITLHRREYLELNCEKLMKIVVKLAKQYPELHFKWVTHPNNSPKKYASQLPRNLSLMMHQSYEDFVKNYESSCIVITDSGGVVEEAAYFGIPMIVFRDESERLEPLEANYPMIISTEMMHIFSFFEKFYGTKKHSPFLFGEGNASNLVLNWILENSGFQKYDAVIVGGGPAGTGLLFKALKDGKIEQLKKPSIAVVEKSSSLVTGNLTNYNINSDTLSDVFLECLEGATGDVLPVDTMINEINRIRAFKGRSIPLQKLKGYFKELGVVMRKVLEEKVNCKFYMNTTVSRIVRLDSNKFLVYMSDSELPLITDKLIMATGGKYRHRDANFSFGGIKIAPYQQKLISSDSLLKNDMVTALKRRLSSHSRILILGGSHSAFSCAHFLLSQFGEDFFAKESIEIWCRKTPKLFFASREEAESEGYTDFSDHDICPVTNRVYRLAGLRMDGREVYMNMLGLRTSISVGSLKLRIIEESAAELEQKMQEADLIVSALGYSFNMVPFVDQTGEPLPLQGKSTGTWVNKKCQVIGENAEIIPGLFATGMATGFIPSGELGGESTFTGQTNGVWYYQNVIAGMILPDIIESYNNKKKHA